MYSCTALPFSEEAHEGLLAVWLFVDRVSAVSADTRLDVKYFLTKLITTILPSKFPGNSLLLFLKANCKQVEVLFSSQLKTSATYFFRHLNLLI